MHAETREVRFFVSDGGQAPWICMSSANTCILRLKSYMSAIMSAVNRAKSMGPKTDPWGPLCELQKQTKKFRDIEHIVNVQ